LRLLLIGGFDFQRYMTELNKGVLTMKLRTGEPWMPAPDYGRSLRGLSLNLLVRDVNAALPFYRDVLGAEVVYSDPDFAVLRYAAVEWMLHADHTYQEHPLAATLGAEQKRGIGAEIRLHDCDPDQAEAAARDLGFTVLVPATDKGHGLREVYLLDQDGYVWVPDTPLVNKAS
jgi:catechol 2,3-dioxygenase-like lactoylglutathione lyase family enzyme